MRFDVLPSIHAFLCASLRWAFPARSVVGKANVLLDMRDKAQIALPVELLIEELAERGILEF